MSSLLLRTAAMNKLMAVGKSVVLATPSVVRATVITGGALLAGKKLDNAVTQIRKKRKIQRDIKKAKKRIQKDIKDPKMQKELKKEFRRIEMKFSLKSLKKTQKKIDDLRNQEIQELAQELKHERALRR